MLDSIVNFISTIKQSLIRTITPPTIIYPNNEVTVIPAAITDVMSYIRQFYSSLDEQQFSTIKFSYDDLANPKPKCSNKSLIPMSERYNALVGVHSELYWILFLDSRDFIAFHNDKIIASINNSSPDKREIFITPTIETLKPNRNLPSIIRGWHRKTLEDLVARSILIFKSVHQNNKLREKYNLNHSYWIDFFNSPLSLERFHHKIFELFDRNKHLFNKGIIGSRIVCYPYFPYLKVYFQSMIERRELISLYDFLNNWCLLNAGCNYANIGYAYEYLKQIDDEINITPVTFDNKIWELKQRDSFLNIDLKNEAFSLSRIFTPSPQTYTLIGYWRYKDVTNTLTDEWITFDTYFERIVNVTPYTKQDFEQRNANIIDSFLIKLEKNLESLNSILNEVKKSGRNDDDDNIDTIIAIKQEIKNKEIHLSYLKHFTNEIFPQDIEVI